MDLFLKGTVEKRAGGLPVGGGYREDLPDATSSAPGRHGGWKGDGH